MKIKNLFENILLFVLGYFLLISLNIILTLIISIPGLFIGFAFPYVFISLIFLYLTYINIFNFDFKIVKKSRLNLFVFIVLIFIYSILSWNSFLIKEGEKQGFNDTTINSHEYSDKYWYFLNRTHPIFPFTHNGAAYIDENHNLSIPDGYRSLAVDKNRIGWHSIVSDKFYYFSFIVATLFGLNVSLIIIRRFKFSNISS